MTVVEAIKLLEACPPGAILLTRGYESGYDTAGEIRVIKARKDGDGTNWMFGEYEEEENEVMEDWYDAGVLGVYVAIDNLKIGRTGE